MKSEEYKIRFPSCQRLQDAYENAVDCIADRIPFYSLYWCGVSKNTASGIWRLACMDTGTFL